MLSSPTVQAGQGTAPREAYVVVRVFFLPFLNAVIDVEFAVCFLFYLGGDSNRKGGRMYGVELDLAVVEKCQAV